MFKRKLYKINFTTYMLQLLIHYLKGKCAGTAHDFIKENL